MVRAREEGVSALTIEEAEVLKNDGLGTKANLRLNNLNISVSVDAGAPIKPKENEDKNPPESFKPEIGRDENIFDGKYFLAFATQDKGTGIDHYEVKEGFWGKYIIAESPYLINDQSLGKVMYIKAVDKASNERVVKFIPDNAMARYQHYMLLGIILLIVFVVIFRKKIWSRNIN